MDAATLAEKSTVAQSAATGACLTVHSGLPFLSATADLGQIGAGEHVLTESEALPLQRGNLRLLVCGGHFLCRLHDESG
ncbi:hypothetical protein [Xanthomonas hortorum]|uniref:hypothetical protein n=1 Tax=Xanthomonas hortorum TaxID=56454 RepID=UPI001594DE37|nr:hypothetical protein [Xanthomonas hortorum]